MLHETLEPAQHEPTDVGMRFIFISVAVLVFSVVFLALVVLWLFPGGTVDKTFRLPLPQYPQPRLQYDPRADMEKFYHEEMQRLNSAGWIDRSKGVAHIPIDDAMTKIAEQDIPGWPGASPSPALAQKETPHSSQLTEKPHETAPSARLHARRVDRGHCWIDARSRRRCVRAKARRGSAAAGGV